MTKKLKHIATVSTGLYRKPDPVGDAVYLTGKHFDEFGNLKNDAVLIPEIAIDSNSHRHLLETNDVLFIAKGDNNRACIYPKGLGKAIASSLFFVIRPKDNSVLPEYLKWFLNTSATQKKLEQMARGSRIRSISIKSIYELEVPSPSFETQLQILRVNENWINEKKLTDQLLKKKELFYQKTLLNFLNSDKNEI